MLGLRERTKAAGLWVGRVIGRVLDYRIDGL